MAYAGYGGVTAATGQGMAELPDDDNELVALVAELQGQVAELRQRLAAAESASLSDPLTGLPNLRAWQERFEAEEERSRRTGEPAVVVVVDLDELKLINDRDGHAAGDELLRTAAEVLQSTTRGSDVLARVGGDEFHVLITATDDVASVSTRLRRALRDAGVDASVGAAVAQAGSYPNALREADKVMYATKEARRVIARQKRGRDGGSARPCAERQDESPEH